MRGPDSRFEELQCPGAGEINQIVRHGVEDNFRIPKIALDVVLDRYTGESIQGYLIVLSGYFECLVETFGIVDEQLGSNQLDQLSW